MCYGCVMEVLWMYCNCDIVVVCDITVMLIFVFLFFRAF